MMLNTQLPAQQPSAIANADGEFAEAVIDGLSAKRKSLPCRFFYDARGSELFEEITQLAEYYPTRAESSILAEHAREMAAGIADGSVLIEFGSGSSRKTEMLLSALPRLRAYIPIDVSSTALDEAKRRLQARFPSLDVWPIVGDFSGPIEIRPDLATCPRTGFFPGSTIGNLGPSEAVDLLVHMRKTLATGGQLIIGVDLKKDPRTLVRAYNDERGMTAEFNLNLLARINREIEPAFDLKGFRHRAIYDPVTGRIEMHLVSVKAQTVALLGRIFYFRAGETIHTENSYKYTVDEFQVLCRKAGWRANRVWTDSAALFSVHEMLSAA